jgi:ubiquitin-protein ligase
MTVEQIAHVCHDANRALCLTNDDTSQHEWFSAPGWQVKSAIKGVEFCLSNPDAPASANHEAWLATKEADGWIYGEVKDEHAKTHHCMVPYDQLPQFQKAKDHLFKAIVASLEPFLK